ncbi:NIF3 NGG1 interactin-like proteing factor 3-like 1 [Halenospora varia]|nr:NIF3 NGG1 interactin-like proteing factor 3-like 1 [Halenospora varia]
MAAISPFSKAVIAAVKNLYPEDLADKSFDNTGLLLESPSRPHLNKSALITVDLTKAVADEAIKRKDSIIIAYHPIIFRPLKSLTLSNTQQTTLLRLAQEGISVYSPHTAVDAAPGGLNDWLADVVCSGVESSIRSIDRRTLTTNFSRGVITPVAGPPGFEGAGYGRIVRFASPQRLGELVSKINSQLGLHGCSVATPQNVPLGGHKGQLPISSVGICAGSGGSMLAGLDVDLVFTGELSHHEALAIIEKGKCVVTTFHSNSERAFFRRMMQPKMVVENGFDISVSEMDRDPFDIVRRGESWLEEEPDQIPR